MSQSKVTGGRTLDEHESHDGRTMDEHPTWPKWIVCMYRGTDNMYCHPITIIYRGPYSAFLYLGPYLIHHLTCEHLESSPFLNCPNHDHWLGTNSTHRNWSPNKGIYLGFSIEPPLQVDAKPIWVIFFTCFGWGNTFVRTCCLFRITLDNARLW